MVKNLLQDMVVNKSSRSGNISTPPKKKIWEEMRESKEERYEEEEPDYNSYRYDTEEGKPKYRLWVVALFAVVMLLFALSFLFGKATININPTVSCCDFMFDFIIFFIFYRLVFI